jgi:ABC-2 type transport system ATP-binding protein
VRWSRDGQSFARSTRDATSFVYGLFREYGEAITDLEVRRASLEDTYLRLVREAELDGVPR